MNFPKATVAALATAPAAARGWSIGPSFFPTSLVFQSPAAASQLYERQRQLARAMFDQQDLAFSSPRYELVDNDEKFQLSVDVPGVEMSDIDVSIDDGYITVKGQRTESSKSSHFSSKFSQTFSLDPAVDVDKFTATLNSGVLVVSAPKDMKRLEENVKRIPITSGEAASSTNTDDSHKKTEGVTATNDADAVLDLDKE